MAADVDNPVTQWIGDLRTGNGDEASRLVWERYYSRPHDHAAFEGVDPAGLNDRDFLMGVSPHGNDANLLAGRSVTGCGIGRSARSTLASPHVLGGSNLPGCLNDGLGQGFSGGR